MLTKYLILAFATKLSCRELNRVICSDFIIVLVISQLNSQRDILLIKSPSLHMCVHLHLTCT